MPRPHQQYRTRAVILRRHDLGETDRILTIFTRAYGKKRAVAKGVRKPQNRKAGHVELFSEVDALISVGRSLDVLSQVEMVNSFYPLRADLEHTTYALHVLELVDAFTEDDDAFESLYDLLVQGLHWLEETDKLGLVISYFELQLLAEVGYQPQLFHCVICDDDLKPVRQYFSIADGGVVCPSCGETTPRTRKLSLNAFKVLRHMVRNPYQAIAELSITPRVQGELNAHLRATLAYHLERRLKSAAFLDRLRREAF